LTERASAYLLSSLRPALGAQSCVCAAEHAPACVHSPQCLPAQSTRTSWELHACRRGAAASQCGQEGHDHAAWRWRAKRRPAGRQAALRMTLAASGCPALRPPAAAACSSTRWRLAKALRPPHARGRGGRARRAGPGAGPRRAPDGDGAASTGSRPRWIRQRRAVSRPSRCHLKPSFLSCGTTSVMIGCGGRYLLTRLAVWPARAQRPAALSARPWARRSRSRGPRPAAAPVRLCMALQRACSQDLASRGQGPHRGSAST